MDYRVSLVNRRNQPIVTTSGLLCLGHLTHLLYLSATKGVGGEFTELIQLANTHWEAGDSSFLPADGLPHFDRSCFWNFVGIGAWGAGNVSGALELLLTADTYVQIGLQTRIHRIAIFGARRAADNVLSDITSAVAHCYPSDDGLATGGPGNKYLHLADERTFCYVNTTTAGGDPVVTCRFGNRAVWEPSLDE